MPVFNTGVQLSCALTDLVNSLLTLPFLLHLQKLLPESRISRLWLRVLVLVAAGSFLGFVTHGFLWSWRGWLINWAVLYPVLIAACNDFLRLGLVSFSGGRLPGRVLDRALNLAIPAMWALLMGLFFLLHDEPIRVFITYAAAIVIPAFMFHIRLALRGHRGSRILLTAFLPLLVGAVLMMLRMGSFTLFGLPFDHNSIFHLCLMASIPIFYLAARNWETT